MKKQAKNEDRSVFFLVGLVLLTGLGFWLRLKGLSQSTSFWVDEASTAHFARAIIKRGTPTVGGFTDWRYFLHYYLVACSMKLFGLDEFGARLPSVFFGTFSIIVTYLLAKRVSNRWVGLATSALVAFSVLQITWSRQARGYAVVQFLFLVSLWATLSFVLKEKKRLTWLGLGLATAVLAGLTHPLGWLLVAANISYLVLANWREIMIRIGRPRGLIVAGFLLILAGVFFVKTNFLTQIQPLLPWRNPAFEPVNNFRYYHSFFWRQYGLMTFLALGGFLTALLRKEKEISYLVVVLGLYFGFIFFAYQPFVRYPFIFMPLIFFFAMKMVDFKMARPVWVFLVAIFVILNGHKFTLTGESFYSLNADMREVPEPDFKSAYEVVLAKTEEVGLDQVAIVVSHNDPADWYLGEHQLDYLLTQREWFVKNCRQFGSAYGAPFSDPEFRPMPCFSSPGDFEVVKAQFGYGLVIVDRTILSPLDRSMTDWFEEELVLEYRSERIAEDIENNWPIEVYSWGFSDAT